VENNTERPVKTRYIYTTMELCLNRNAGENGSLELIISNPRHESPAFYYWPLNIFGQLHSDQIADLCVVIGQECTETVWTRLNVQDQIPGLLQE
jgi:hypothetical protein